MSSGIDIDNIGSGSVSTGLTGTGAGTPTLGALQTNVASQFIAGTNTRMYVRFTEGATPVAAGSPIALVTFSAPLASVPYLVLTGVAGASLYGDTVTPTIPGAELFYIDTPTVNGFTLRARNGGLANAVYACIVVALL